MLVYLHREHENQGKEDSYRFITALHGTCTADSSRIEDETHRLESLPVFTVTLWIECLVSMFDRNINFMFLSNFNMSSSRQCKPNPIFFWWGIKLRSNLPPWQIQHKPLGLLIKNMYDSQLELNVSPWTTVLSFSLPGYSWNNRYCTTGNCNICHLDSFFRTWSRDTALFIKEIESFPENEFCRWFTLTNLHSEDGYSPDTVTG